MKKVEAAKWEAQRPADRPAAQHADEMSALERERFSLAKSINDLESHLVHYEAVLASQKATLALLQEENQAGAKEPASRIELEWNLYKQLGVDWLEHDEGAGVTKARVKDMDRNDIHILELDNAKIEPVQQANLLWSLCQSSSLNVQ